MIAISRKKLVVLNAAVVIVNMLVSIVLGMYEVRLLILKYGSTVNGLMQTGKQLLGYLSLIEAGIGAAFLYRLYKPIANNDDNELSSLYTGFQKSIKKIVIKMLAAAVLVSAIYPVFLKKDGLSYPFMLTIFVLLSLKTILPYLFSYVQKYMIIANEQRYKAEIISCVSLALTYSVEIILMKYTDLPLAVLLLICVFIAVATGFIYQIVMEKIFQGRLDKNAVPDMSPNTMSKDILAHNISGLVFNSTDNIIISTFSSLANVTIYSNYNTITHQIYNIFHNVFAGVKASMGVKIAHKDSNSYDVYRKMFSGTLSVGVIICSVFIVMINDFIKLWVGNEFCSSVFNCYLFGYIMFCSMLLPCIEVARDAKGLFKESKGFTIAQAVVNLVITIALTPFIGITGALIGTFVARVCVTIPFNYQLVEKQVFPGNKSKWPELIVSGLLILVISGSFLMLFNSINFAFIKTGTISGFIVKTIIVTFITCLITIGFYWMTDKHFKGFVKEIKSFFSHK